MTMMMTPTPVGETIPQAEWEQRNEERMERNDDGGEPLPMSSAPLPPPVVGPSIPLPLPPVDAKERAQARTATSVAVRRMYGMARWLSARTRGWPPVRWGMFSVGVCSMAAGAVLWPMPLPLGVPLLLVGAALLLSSGTTGRWLFHRLIRYFLPRRSAGRRQQPVNGHRHD